MDQFAFMFVCYQRLWKANGLTVDHAKVLLLLLLFGADLLAMAMSVAMKGGKKKVDLIESLKKAGFEHLAIGLRAPLKVWRLLDDLFSYAKLVPRWMPSESVASKSTVIRFHRFRYPITTFATDFELWW